jgi:hypothetical protein
MLASGGNSTGTYYIQNFSNQTVTPVKQLRMAAIIGYRNPDKISGSGSATITQFGISILGADQDSVNDVKDAANAASNAAQQASANATIAASSALSAYNAVNNANGNTVTAVRDSSGTVLDEARQAKTNALNSYNQTVSVSTKLDGLTTTINNIQNNIGADTSPPEVKISTASGALATSGNTIRAVIDVSDNVSTAFDYSLDGTAYQPLPHDGVIYVPVSSHGSNLITVWVKDEAGNTGRASIILRKL